MKTCFCDIIFAIFLWNTIRSVTTCSDADVKSLLWRDEMRIWSGHISSACYSSDTDVSTPFVLVVDEHQVTAAVIGWHPASQVASLWCCPWCCSTRDKEPRALGFYFSFTNLVISALIAIFIGWIQYNILYQSSYSTYCLKSSKKVAGDESTVYMFIII